jgi:hypothetical protein
MGASNQPNPRPQPKDGQSWPERVADILRRIFVPGGEPQLVPVPVPVPVHVPVVRRGY